MARYIPKVRKTIEAELQEIEKRFEEERIELIETTGCLLNLPEKGLDHKHIIEKVDQYLELGNCNWKDGFVSGAVYNYDEEIVELMTDVYKRTAYTNPLHADIFSGICKMEAEVIRMAANLFNGDDNTCGSISSGGTESILLACRSYRNFSKETNGITQPNMVIPNTAHTAFDKAADYLGIHVRKVKVDEKTFKVDLKALEKAINRNTIMIVGSAPNYPYGTMDDIEKIAEIASKYNIPMHVDACLGGFLNIFMKSAGHHIPKFDFSVKGVTSISADLHKYGYTPKGKAHKVFRDFFKHL